MDFGKYIKDNQLTFYYCIGDNGGHIDIEGFSVVNKNNNWYVDIFINDDDLMFKGDLNNIITFLADMFYHDIIEYEL